MNKRHFLAATCSLIIATVIPSSLTVAAETEAFALRKIYPEIRTIDTTTLANKLNDLTVVDVRPAFEYELLHIKGAINLPLEDSKFVENAKKANSETGKALVFYCGTETCAKSYQAVMKVRKDISLERTWAYDSGIEAWIKANPQLTISLDKPLNTKSLISEEKFKAHLLSPKDFISKATADTNAKVVDLRDRSQVDGVSLFPLREIRTNLDIPGLRKIFTEAKQANQAIYIYDYAGNKIKSLQYLLEEMGVKDYYFMHGGMGGYFDMLQGK